MDPLRPLGRTGLHVSPIGLGTVKLGRNTGMKYPRPFDLPTDEQAAALLAAAADSGVNLIDTAPAYGVSETRLGELLSKAAWFGGRDRWVLSSKAGEEFDGVSTFDFSAAAVHASVRRSLTRLRTDFLDVVFIHSNGDDEGIIRDGGAVEALLELKQAGLVRAIGTSPKTLPGALAAMAPFLAAGAAAATAPTAAPRDWCDVLMLVLNPADHTHLPAVLEAGRRGVGVLIKKGLASGHLAPPSGSPAASASPNDPVEASLRDIFTSAGDAVSSVVTGTLTPAHLRHNVAAARRVLATLKS